MADHIVIVGGGPSGMAAAYESVSRGAAVTVVERLERVGGLSRTIAFEDCRFDIGPHRFFTRNDEVRGLFHRVLGKDLVTVRRQTRILHDNLYFDYPLTPLNAITGIGLRPGLGIAGSYVAARIRGVLAPRPAQSFEDWVVAHFGRALYRRFFQTYTEKVWGIPCGRIGADWASQRIRGLSLATAVRNAVFKTNASKAKTLVDEFAYPRLGAGQTYEKMAGLVVAGGGHVLTRSTVKELRCDGARVRTIVIEDAAGERHEIEGSHFLTSAPLTDTVEMCEPSPPGDVLRACRSLRYRDHIGVNLMVEGSVFPDNWIYVHSREVGLARIANYRNFSSEMASRPDISPLTVEYFSFPGDALSFSSDESLIETAIDELQRLGILERARLINAFVVRSEKAYPVMEVGYDAHVAIIKAWLDRFENLLPIGRSGMFKYNNQDHAIATGLLAARNVLGLGPFDPWLVNIDAEYHEGGEAAAPKDRPGAADGSS